MINLSIKASCICFAIGIYGCGQHERIDYYPSGKIKRQAFLDSEGGLVGNVNQYHENGKIERIIPFENNLVNGVVKSYYSSGEIYLVESWENGKRNGKTIAYYPTGQIKYQATLRDTIRIDTAKWHYVNGQLRYWARYDKRGRKVDFSSYKPNGEINTKLMYPLFLSDSDTISVGRDYLFEIVLGNRRTNAISIRFINSVSKIDSFPGLYSKSKYRIIKPQLGENVVQAQISQHWLSSDTVWTNWYNVKHKFYVK